MTGPRHTYPDDGQFKFIPLFSLFGNLVRNLFNGGRPRGARDSETTVVAEYSRTEGSLASGKASGSVRTTDIGMVLVNKSRDFSLPRGISYQLNAFHHQNENHAKLFADNRETGEPSPLSSPVDPRSASPEVALWMPKIQTQTNLSVQTDDLETKGRLSVDAAPSDYDYLARSEPIILSAM